MKPLILGAAFLAATTGATLAADSSFKDFVRAEGDQLVCEGRPFRFVSWNIPNLHLVEDNVRFEELNPWRLPDEFEIGDALATVRDMGGQVVRTYVISVRRTNEGPEIPRHVLGPGKFHEEAFRALDKVLCTANEQGIRLILPFVDNWSWWGGRTEYTGFRGKSKEAFWTDRQVIADFKETIRFVLTRTNTISGMRYADDKAVLCWETGNELESPAEWTREIAAFIKQLAPKQLVMDGFHATELRAESLSLPEVDVVTTHHYPGGKRSFQELIRENAARAKGRKPYVVGEFGFVDFKAMAAAIEAVIETQTSGALAWSLRFRNRDGGFYWHSEPAGGNKYKAFHWPGSPVGADYDEQPFMALMRERAFEIRGLPAPPLAPPAPPRLLQVSSAGLITWQGSVGANDYVIERAGSESGPWTAAGEADESFVQYHPLFADESAMPGTWYYRVRARNSVAMSQPSNVLGPVKVRPSVFVDELADLKRVRQLEGKVEIRSRDCRQAKEDAHRATAGPGASLLYQLPGDLESFRVFAFFPGEIQPPKFSLSVDGGRQLPVTPSQKLFFRGGGDYGYWKPVLFEAQDLPSGKFLRIEFTGEIQVGRIEILHKSASK